MFATLALLMLATFVLTARRGPTYTAVIAAVFCYLLVRPTLLKLWKVAVTLGSVGLLMIALRMHAPT